MPPLRYFCTISSRENGSHDSSGRNGPSSTRTTSRPASARRQAVMAPPGPEPMTAISARSRSGGSVNISRMPTVPERRPPEYHQRLVEPDEIAAGAERDPRPRREMPLASLGTEPVEAMAGERER